MTNYSNINAADWTEAQKEAVFERVVKQHTGKYASKVLLTTLGDWMQFGKIHSGRRNIHRKLQGFVGAWFVQHLGEKREIEIESAYFDDDTNEAVSLSWEWK